jgi:hypothetical protein
MKDGLYIHKRKDIIALKVSELFGIAYTLSYPIGCNLNLTILRKDFIWIGEF